MVGAVLGIAQCWAASPALAQAQLSPNLVWQSNMSSDIVKCLLRDKITLPPNETLPCMCQLGWFLIKTAVAIMLLGVILKCPRKWMFWQYESYYQNVKNMDTGNETGKGSFISYSWGSKLTTRVWHDMHSKERHQTIYRQNLASPLWQGYIKGVFVFLGKE